MGFLNGIIGFAKAVLPVASMFIPALAPIVGALKVLDGATSNAMASAGKQVSARANGGPPQTLEDLENLGLGWGRELDLSQSALATQ